MFYINNWENSIQCSTEDQFQEWQLSYSLQTKFKLRPTYENVG